MIPTVLRLVLFAILGWCATAGRGAPYRIHYVIRPVPPAAGREAALQVAIHVSGLAGEKSIRFQAPVWSPGDYHVMNHGQFFRDAFATSAPDHANRLTRIDENTWEVATDGFESVTFRYSVPNVPPGFFSENNRITGRFAFYNGPAVYAYVVGHKQDPATLQLALPADWKAAITPLAPQPPSAGSAAGRPDGHIYSAPDYDTLADSPVLMGDFVTREFTAAGRPHALAFFRDTAGMDFDSYPPVIARVAEEENRVMNGPPYQRYVFFFDVGGPGGGLEHLNASRIALSPRMPGRYVAGIVAHEFFHLWNVKRIRPFVLGPFDYVEPPKTRNLWFAEGVTSYYGDLSVLRAGLVSEENYLRGIGGSIAALMANPARLRVSADESSFRVWEAGNSSGYGGLSYYHKGELIGLCLDLKIRGMTANRRGLDHVMRDLMNRYGLPKAGYPEDGIREAAIRAGGSEMGPFYDRLARSTEEMPFDECLRYAGLTIRGRQITPVPGESPSQIALRRSWLSGK